MKTYNNCKILLYLRWMEQNGLAANNQERLWLHHEIGNCHLDANRHDVALEWGLLLHLLSLDEQDQTWSVYAVVLMAKTEGYYACIVHYLTYTCTINISTIGIKLNLE